MNQTAEQSLIDEFIAEAVGELAELQARAFVVKDALQKGVSDLKKLQDEVDGFITKIAAYKNEQNG